MTKIRLRFRQTNFADSALGPDASQRIVRYFSDADSNDFRRRLSQTASLALCASK
jgi:hypothetical protein